MAALSHEEASASGLAAALRRLSEWAPWAALAAALSAAVALSAIVGWVVDVPRLRSVLPGAVEMKMNTGVCLLACAAALLVATNSTSRAARRIVQALAAVPIAIGAATLCEYGFGWSLGIDEFFVLDTATAYNVYRGRMSPYTAGAFICLGIAIALLAAHRLRPVKWACASAVIAIGGVSALGYLWNAQELITDRLVPPVAINTAIVLMLLGFATLHAGRRAWEMRSGMMSPRLFSMERKVVASLVGALALLFLGGGYTYRATAQFDDAMSAFAAQQDARAALARILDLAGDAEMAHESFVLGGRTAKRDLYVERQGELSAPLATLNRLLGDDRTKAALLQTMHRDIAEWFGRMDATVLARQRSGAVPADYVPGRADPARERIRDTVRQLDVGEARAQADQRLAAARLREFTLASLLLTLAVASALCFMLYRAMRRSIEMRAEARRMDGMAREVFRLLVTTLDRGRALDGTVVHLAQLRRNGGCGFYALHPDHRLVLESSAGECAQLPPRLALGQGRIGQAAVTGHSSQAPDDPRLFATTQARPAPSLFACPVVYLGRTAGVLVLTGTRGLRTFEQSFVERIADALGAALGNLQTYADLQGLSAELREKNDALVRQAAELDQANRMKTEFLATMSHELRTPLNAIIGFAEVLKDDLVGALTEQQREYIGDILDSGEHLLQLINDILDLSKVEAGKMDLDLEPVDLKPLFENSLAMVKEKALAHRIDLSAAVDDTLASAWLDARKIKQIVYNLLSNAVKFTPTGGTVALRVARAGPGDAWLEIAVSDTGIGIAAADQARLFQPFMQIDGSLAKQFQGTGLGLAMVKRLAELHGGSATLDSTPGSGSTFTVLLPLRETTEDGPVVERLAPPYEGARTVMLVEPDPDAAQLIRDELHGAGLDMIHVPQLDDALAAVAQQPPDVVLLSAALPTEGSNAFVARLSGDASLARISVVLLSGAGGAEAGHARGADGVPARQDLRAALAALALRPETTRRLTALVVDDEPRVAEVFDAYLQAGGLRVIRVTNGADALAEACAEQPDVIVLDLMMPHMSGFDVIQMIRTVPATRAIPIVVITAKSLTAQDRSALAGQVQDVITKTEFKRNDFVDAVVRAAVSVDKV